MDKPISSPTHRAYQEAGRKEEVQMDVTPHSAAPISVPQILLPPEGNESGKQEQEMKKRANSLNRYDGEQERNEADMANANTTVQRRVSRSNSVRNQSDKNNDKNVKNEKNVNRGSQSFALRQKKKGPPPPPPKRSSSAISSSSTNLNDMPKDTGTGNLLDVNYNPQRRASAVETGVTVETGCGGAVETGSAGSVRSIAAMLEMSSIGGGAKGLAMQRSTAHYLQVGNNLLIPFPYFPTFLLSCTFSSVLYVPQVYNRSDQEPPLFHHSKTLNQCFCQNNWPTAMHSRHPQLGSKQKLIHKNE